MNILTSEQMSSIDKATIASGIPGIELMRNAGRSVADFIINNLTVDKKTCFAVVCGKGNNGGDGFRVSEILLQKGYNVTAFLTGSKKEDIKGDALICFNDAVSAGLELYEINELKELNTFKKKLNGNTIIVDSVFGTGLKGEIIDISAKVIDIINGSGKIIVAVDIPSGVNGSTGFVSEKTVIADYTVTFGEVKAGHVLKPGRFYCGEIYTFDIGFDKKIMRSVKPVAYTLSENEAAALIPDRKFDTYKTSAGKIFIVASSVGMTGAAALCANASMRTGAGVVTVGCPESLNDILEVKLTEPMTLPLPEVRKKRCLSIRALGKIREFSKNSDVIAIGPGLGTNFETSELVRRFVSEYTGKIIIDADAIKAFKNKTEILKKSPAQAVLTPHPGELSILLDLPIKDIILNPAEYAAKASAETGKIVVLKGANTLIADTNGEIWINSTGNEGMATAGMGDVLTGIIAGFAAQGLSLSDAAVLGVYIHGLSGDISVRNKGIHGLIASDVLAGIPDAILNCKITI